jgi:hypothetical protein
MLYGEKAGKSNPAISGTTGKIKTRKFGVLSKSF